MNPPGLFGHRRSRKGPGLCVNILTNVGVWRLRVLMVILHQEAVMTCPGLGIVVCHGGGVRYRGVVVGVAVVCLGRVMGGTGVITEECLGRDGIRTVTHGTKTGIGKECLGTGISIMPLGTTGMKVVAVGGKEIKIRKIIVNPV